MRFLDEFDLLYERVHQLEEEKHSRETRDAKKTAVVAGSVAVFALAVSLFNTTKKR